jgi:hypothetical protein
MTRNAVLFLSALLLAFVLLVNEQAVQSQSAVAATVVATVEVAARMEPPPTTCGPSPEPLEVSKHYAPVLGSRPIWGTIGYGRDERKGVLVMSKEPAKSSRLPGWWVQKVLWLVKTNYKGEVKLRGYNLADNSPMYFSIGGDIPIAVAALNPEKPEAYAAGSDQFANFPSLVWVSKAGCYVIEAQWEGGLWRQTVAVGYVEEP